MIKWPIRSQMGTLRNAASTASCVIMLRERSNGLLGVGQENDHGARNPHQPFCVSPISETDRLSERQAPLVFFARLQDKFLFNLLSIKGKNFFTFKNPRPLK